MIYSFINSISDQLEFYIYGLQLLFNYNRNNYQIKLFNDFFNIVGKNKLDEKGCSSLMLEILKTKDLNKI